MNLHGNSIGMDGRRRRTTTTTHFKSFQSIEDSVHNPKTLISVVVTTGSHKYIALWSNVNRVQAFFASAF